MTQPSVTPPTVMEALANPVLSNVIAIRYAAKVVNSGKENHKFHLGLVDYAELLTAPTCAYTDVPLSVKKCTLERVNPLLDYTKENTISISESANQLKSAIFDSTLRSHGGNNFNKLLGDSLKILSRMAKHQGFELEFNDKDDVVIKKPTTGVDIIKVGSKVKIDSSRSKYNNMIGKVILIDDVDDAPLYHVHIANVNPEPKPGSRGATFPRQSAVAKVRTIALIK